MHPESVDPPWFQELVSIAFLREMKRNLSQGQSPDESLESAMWYVFDLRNDMVALYQASLPED